MKNLFLSILIALASIISISGNAQTSQPSNPVSAVQVQAVAVGTFTIKSGEILPVYKGSRGGLYCFRTSGKTGLPYKQYLKPEQVVMN